MIVIPLAGNGVTAQEAPKQEQVTGAKMTPNNNNIVAWARDTGKRLRLSTYDMAGEEGWRPLVYADNYAGAMNKAKNEEQTTGRSMSKHAPGPWLTRESATHVTVTNAKAKGEQA